MSDKFEALSRLNFEKWMAGDYSPDRSPEATSAGEDAFKSVMWHIYSSAQLPLLAALEEKDARVAACVNAFEGIETERIAGKTLGEFLAGEVRLNKAEPKPDGSFGFTFSGFAVQIMAEAFADQFKSSGAVNYLELLFEHKEIGPLTVTMQRVEGLTPSQKLAAAEQREEHLKATVDVLSAKNAELEQRLQQPIKLPDGFRIVPIKPTREQLAVVQVAGKSVVYTDMVLAAPEHPGFKVEGE